MTDNPTPSRDELRRATAMRVVSLLHRYSVSIAKDVLSNELKEIDENAMHDRLDFSTTRTADAILALQGVVPEVSGDDPISATYKHNYETAEWRANRMAGKPEVSGEPLFLIIAGGDGMGQEFARGYEPAARAAYKMLIHGEPEDADANDYDLAIYNAVKDPDSEEWSDAGAQGVFFSFEDGFLQILRIEAALQGVGAGWRDIESAPKDGTLIIAHRFPCEDSGNTFGHLCSLACWDQSWRWMNGLYLPPTHWMPLPTPPEASDETVQ